MGESAKGKTLSANPHPPPAPPVSPQRVAGGDKGGESDVSCPQATLSGSRVVALDALRGFDMFWIIGRAGAGAGGGRLVSAAAAGWLEYHLEHVEWQGFSAWDLIMPSVSVRGRRGDAVFVLATARAGAIEGRPVSEDRSPQL